MSERFFTTAAPQDGRALLTGDEARHLAKVLRAREGDAVVLFDGRGRSWPARVTRIGRDSVDLDAGDPVVDAASAAVRLTLAVALPKGERQKWMVEKITELGVGRLVPLETTRGVAEATEGARARLERGVIEACKQCGRNTLLEIAAGQTLAQLLSDRTEGVHLVIAHPGGGPLDAAVPATATGVIVLIGPEGGFTDEELAAVDRAGASRVSLGPHILRVETAAIAVAARLVAAASGHS